MYLLRTLFIKAYKYEEKCKHFNYVFIKYRNVAAGMFCELLIGSNTTL